MTIDWNPMLLYLA